MRGNIENSLKALRALRYVSIAKIVGSYAKGKRHPKDIDILIRVNIKDTTFLKNRRGIGSDVKRIIRRKSSPLPLDLFFTTSDNKHWRLRPWQDITTKRTTYEWE